MWTVFSSSSTAPPPGNLAHVVGVQQGRHVRVHLSQAAMQLGPTQLLQLHLPARGALLLSRLLSQGRSQKMPGSQSLVY